MKKGSIPAIQTNAYAAQYTRTAVCRTYVMRILVFSPVLIYVCHFTRKPNVRPPNRAKNVDLPFAPTRVREATKTRRIYILIVLY